MGRSKRKDDLLNAYSRIRKPVPPPERVERNRRKQIAEQLIEKDVQEELKQESPVAGEYGQPTSDA